MLNKEKIVGFKKPNKIIAKSLKFIGRQIVKKRAIIKFVGVEKLNIEPPFLVVSNHVNNLDPVFINLLFDEPIVYVVSDRFYKQKIFGTFLKYIGAISKKKNRVDTGTIRSLKKAIDSKRIIGLFPEGMRNWDGRTQVERFKIAKLCKFLKIPILLINIEGGHFNQPRWSDNFQKCEVTLRVIDLITVETIKSCDIDTLNEQIGNMMRYNEQLKTTQTFPLTGIDRVLSYCSVCKTFDNLRVSNEMINCSNCYTTYHFNSYTKISHPISNLSNWIEIQTQFVKKQLEHSSLYLRINTDIRIYDLNRKKIGKETCQIEINKNRLLIDNEIVENFRGVNVQSNNQLELVIGDRIYWIYFEPNQHIFVWYTALHFMRGDKNG
jgi:1-acyl-sn-glycerol-3-phosphate acyltransferase